jgi:hypothetical protein
VLLDGQPLPEARVVFQPVAQPGQEHVGPDAYGVTDAEGRFSLTTIYDESGAAVGRNRVSISTLQLQEDASDPDNGRKRQVLRQEQIPPRYNSQTELYYEVLEEGAAEATFQLQSS